MSQYLLEPLSDRYEVRAGWDRPLSSFFLSVEDREIDEDEADPIIVWLGAGRVPSILDVDPILSEAARWAVIPSELRQKLLTDQRIEGRRVW